MGVPTALTYFIASGHGARRSLRRAFILVTPACLATYAAMGFYAALLSKESGVPLWVYLAAWLLIPLGAYVQVLRAFWQGVAGWRRLDLERSLGSALKFLVVVGLAALGVTGSGSYASLQILSILIASLVLLPARRTLAAGASPTWSRFSSYSLSAWLTLVFLFAGSRLDQALMPAASTTTELGYYAVAVTVSEVPLVAATLLGRESLHASSSGADIRRVVTRGLPYWGVVLLSSGAAAALAPWLVPFAFGESFTASVASVQVLCLSALATTVILFCVAVLSGYGRPRLSAVAPSISFAATVVGFVALWGDVSSLSASWISTLSQGIGAAVGVLLIVRVRPRRPAKASASDDHEGRDQ